MMYGREKSDSAIVAKKPANKVGTPTAERAEPRAGAEGNAGQQRTRRAQNRESVSQKLERVRQAAKLRKKERFTALLHHVTIEFLEQAFYALRRKAAPGIDGQTWTDYEGNLKSHLQNLHGRIHSGAYKALPVRRRFILKADGKQRPLGVTALEDKIVQRAVVEILKVSLRNKRTGVSLQNCTLQIQKLAHKANGDGRNGLQSLPGGVFIGD